MYLYKYQGQERQDELGLNWDSFKWRNYDFTINRFFNIDPLAEDYTYNSPYAFAENKVGLGRELEGCELGPYWSPMLGAMLESTNAPPIVPTLVRTSVEVTTKTVETTGKVAESTGKFSESTLENFARGRNVEAEQLIKNGYEKNTEPITRIDPKTGKEGVTIPDAIKKSGATVEIKNVKNQSLTRQLRLQKAESESKGLKPELIINSTAKISGSLKNSGFDIKYYQTVIENTSVKTDKVLPEKKPEPKTIDPNNIL